MLTDAPIFTPAACEGTSTLFEVNYIDDQKAYLTQCGQLYIEATAMALGKVYTFGPTFRAEKSKTRRHLTEFWMLEPEAAYAHFEDMMDLGEGLVSAVVQGVVKNEPANSKRSSATLRSWRTSSLLSRESPTKKPSRCSRTSGNPAKLGDDFGGDEETIISNSFDRPVMVHRYPAGDQSLLHAARPPAARAGSLL